MMARGVGRSGAYERDVDFTECICLSLVLVIITSWVCRELDWSDVGVVMRYGYEDVRIRDILKKTA